MESNWKCLSTKHIYTNPWITLEEDQVINPGGNEGIYGRVHFKNKAIGIVPLDQDLNTWLVGQYRYPLNEYSWEIPMGGGPMSEDSLIAAQRELKEETGIMAVKWKNIMRIHTSNSVTDEEGFVFVAQDLTFGETEFEDSEDLQIRKLPLSGALDMVLNNEITDSISMAALFKVDHLIRSGDLKGGDYSYR